MIKKIQKTQIEIRKAYFSNKKPWFIAFSGGKDSTLVLLQMVDFLKREKSSKKVVVVYCDTGVEIPIMREYTLNTLKKLQKISVEKHLNIDVIVAKPDINDSFFVNVIGKGYVPPSFMFRWCTDRLRTRPLQKATGNCENVIVLGTRLNESSERNRVLKSNQISEYMFKQRNYAKTTIFSPIIDYKVDEVWKAIAVLNCDNIVDLEYLKFLYKGFVGADTIEEDAPGGRYGCWVCTVVRKDKAGENLIKKGFSEIEALMNYRELLLCYRNDPEKRLPNRKNKVEGKGPFKLSVRKELLERLLETQKSTRYELITSEEIDAIYELWKQENLELIHSD